MPNERASPGNGAVELFAAIRADDRGTVARLLAADPSLVGARSAAGETPLHAAVEVDDPDTVGLLLAHGADPEATYGASSHTALSWAVTTNAFGAAEALVRGGVRPDLFCAAGLGDLDAVRAAFDDAGRVRPGASRTGSSRFGEDGRRLPCPPSDPRDVVSDALYIACRNARPEVARELMGRGADPAFRGYLGGTALHWAYFGGSREVVDLLLAGGADPSARDAAYACTPRSFGICVLASWGMLGLVAARLRDDPTLAHVHEGRGTPLHEAARAGHDRIVALLLACGADPARRDAEGRTPLDLATAEGHAAVCARLRGDPPPA